MVIQSEVEGAIDEIPIHVLKIQKARGYKHDGLQISHLYRFMYLCLSIHILIYILYHVSFIYISYAKW